MTLEAERQIAQERMLDVNANDEDKARKARGGSEEGVCTNCRTYVLTVPSRVPLQSS